MNDNWTIIVVSHGTKQAVLDRNMQLFQRHGRPITVVCPADDPVTTDCPVIFLGKAGPGGSASRAQTWCQVVALAARSATDMVAIFEYDSVCARAELPVGRGVFGILNYTPPHVEYEYLFHCPRYANYPYFCDISSVRRMAAKLADYPAIADYDRPPDRLLPALALLSGVPLLDHNPRGYTAPGGEVLPKHHSDLIKVLESGGRTVHGVKSNEAHEIIWRYID